MLDRQQRDELEGALNLGRLADRMVFTLGRVLRSEPMEVGDVPILERAKRLFELMATEDVIVVSQADDRMLSDESYLDALEVVELRAPNADAEAYAQQYVVLLQRAIAGELTDSDRERLAALRELFSEVGESTLARAGELSRPRRESSWRPPHPATSLS